jgi:hypothetical protein
MRQREKPLAGQLCRAIPGSGAKSSGCNDLGVFSAADKVLANTVANWQTIA